MQDLEKHNGPWSFSPWLATFPPQKKIEKDIIHRGFGVKQNLQSQTFSQVDKGL
jgi:hypothetical protein